MPACLPACLSCALVCVCVCVKGAGGAGQVVHLSFQVQNKIVEVSNFQWSEVITLRRVSASACDSALPQIGSRTFLFLPVLPKAHCLKVILDEAKDGCLFLSYSLLYKQTKNPPKTPYGSNSSSKVFQRGSNGVPPSSVLKITWPALAGVRRKMASAGLKSIIILFFLFSQQEDRNN